MKKSKASEPEPKAVNLTVAQTDDIEKAKDILAKNVEGWADLDGGTQDLVARISMAHASRPKGLDIELQTGEQGSTIAPVGNEVAGFFRMLEALGGKTCSIAALNARGSEIVRYLNSTGGVDGSRFSAAFSFIESMEPENQGEVLLLLQSYTAHDAAIRAISQLGKAEFLPQAQAFGNMAAKLMNASRGHLEAIAKMRRGGEQVVKHVHIDARNSQNVIAESVQTGGQSGKIAGQLHDQSALGPALLGQNTAGNGVPVPGHEERAVQPARGQIDRSAQR